MVEIKASYKQIEDLAVRIGKASAAKAVVLFGSRARGEADTDSDVDLFVVADTGLPYYKRTRQLSGILREYKFPVDLLLYTPKEYKNKKDDKYSVAYYATREGRVLYGQL